MTTDLTSEEIVTRLLTSNEILNPNRKTQYISNPGINLGEFLDNIKEETQTINKGKYTFINLNSGWAW